MNLVTSDSDALNHEEIKFIEERYLDAAYLVYYQSIQEETEKKKLVSPLTFGPGQLDISNKEKSRQTVIITNQSGNSCCGSANSVGVVNNRNVQSKTCLLM